MTPFRSINIHFAMKGNITEAKAQKAIELSMEKYCSATAQLSPSATITHTYSIDFAE
jgi:putative redox protein